MVSDIKKIQSRNLHITLCPVKKDRPVSHPRGNGSIYDRRLYSGWKNILKSLIFTQTLFNILIYGIRPNAPKIRPDAPG